MKPIRQFALLTFAAALAVLLAAAATARAQAPPGPLHPDPNAPREKPRESAPAQMRVRVNLVSLPVTVQNPSGELNFELAQQDFHVSDNGVPQNIEHFDLGGDPLAVALVVETSSRVEVLLPAIRQTGIVFTETVMGQTGEAAVLGFDDSSTVLAPFTSDHDLVEKTIQKLKEGDSGARLYDALSRGVSLLQDRPPNRRRVILLLSEAVDTGSEEKLGAVLREAQLANVTIYAIGLSTTSAELRKKEQYSPPQVGPPGTFPLPKVPGTVQTPSTQQEQMGNIDLMGLVRWIVGEATNPAAERALAAATAATGGMHISTFRERSIQQAMDQIGGELHAQYTLAYRPAGTDAFGYHEIKVQVWRPGLKVRTRPGYYLAPPKT